MTACPDCGSETRGHPCFWRDDHPYKAAAGGWPPCEIEAEPKEYRERQRQGRGAWMVIILGVAVLVGLVWLMISSAHAATFKCRGFSFIYTELECEQPLPPATAGAMFCQVYRPVMWSASDSRSTKEQVDSLNRIWKRLCSKAPPK